VTIGTAGAKAWAVEVLRLTRMPAGEIRAVLATDDPLVVHRVLELHGERLDERAAELRGRLRSLERFLVGTIGAVADEATIAR
jgi:hypothetical protein